MGELKVLPLKDIRDLKGLISREHRLTGKPVSIPALAKKTGIKPHKLRPVAKDMGWIGRQAKGFAPQSYWDKLGQAKEPPMPADDLDIPEVELSTQEFQDAIVHVSEQEQSLTIADVTLEAYYRDIRELWDSLRHAKNDPNLQELQEDIEIFKETTRQHLCEVMKKL